MLNLRNKQTNKQRPIKALETIFNTFQSSFKIDKRERDERWTSDGQGDGQRDKMKDNPTIATCSLSPCVWTESTRYTQKRRQKMTQIFERFDFFPAQLRIHLFHSLKCFRVEDIPKSFVFSQNYLL